MMLTAGGILCRSPDGNIDVIVAMATHDKECRLRTIAIGFFSNSHNVLTRTLVETQNASAF